MMHRTTAPLAAVLLALAACAPQPKTLGPEAEIAAEAKAAFTAETRIEPTTAAERLPERIGPWVRGSAPARDQAGILGRYSFAAANASATISMGDQGGNAVPYGFASLPVAEVLKAMQGQLGNGLTSPMVMRFSDAVPAACLVTRSVAESRGNSTYVCATGMLGQVVRVKVTATYALDNPREAVSMDPLVAILMRGVTRGVANLPQGNSMPAGAGLRRA